MAVESSPAVPGKAVPGELNSSPDKTLSVRESVSEESYTEESPPAAEKAVLVPPEGSKIQSKDEEPKVLPYSRKKKWIAAIVLLTAIAGGVVAAVLVTQKDDDGPKYDEFGTRIDKNAPSAVPSETPSDFPSNLPSSLPSEMPSDIASDVPSQTPTQSPGPTESPSLNPTGSPSAFPTPEELFVKPNPVPDNPPKGYFNYDINDKQFGPDNWRRVDTSRHPLREFGKNGFGVWKGHWADKNPTQNRCGGQARQQSPKDLYGVSGGNEPAKCDAGHEIRSRCGAYPIDSDQYERQILPHKLSLVMNRRPCLEIDKGKCNERQPPRADYPRYSSSLSSYSDLINYDVKVPGEHTLEGKRFDAEIQMLHTHVDKRRISSIGIPVQAEAGAHNKEFQKVLDEFDKQYRADKAACRQSRRRRHLRHYDNTTEDYDPQIYDLTEDGGELYQRDKNSRFNPYSEDLMPDINFYRYDGSTTEPPCFPLTWWVMIEPMIISFEQLNEIKRLLFTHVDENCQKTSVHNADQEVVRPIQPLGKERGIQACPKGSFKNDESKGRGDGNKCP